MKTLNWTSKDLENLPDTLDDTRYEVIDGELYMSKQPHWNHQLVCFQLGSLLVNWSKQSGLGLATGAPGIIFSDDNDVAPDIIWISKERMATALEADGKLHRAPELVVEVLSPGTTNQTRDRETKLKLYSRRGASEYWLIDWPIRQLEVYRRDKERLGLQLQATLYEADTLTSPLLPNFSCQIAEIFENLD